MKKKRVLLTGGAGFIGSNLCRKLLKKKYKVTVIDNLSMGKKKNLPQGVKFIKKNILNYKSCESACKNIDIVIHLAAKVSIRNSVNTLSEDVNNNVNGTINILNASAKMKVKKIIFASSMAVYKSSKHKKPFKENSTLEPISPYGISKLASEKYILLMAPKMKIQPVILRLFNTFGPGQTMTPYVGVITIFVKNMLNNKISKIFGNGNQRRDFIYVEDVVDSFILAMESNKSKNQIFNIGTGKTKSVNDVFKIIKKKIKKGNFVYAPKDDTELNYVCADIKKAKKLLFFKPKNSFDKKVHEVIFKIKKN